MNILFLHPNFPGQFKHLATASSKYGHSVKFLCQTHYGRKISGIERIKLKNSAGNEFLESQNLGILQRANALAEQYRNGFLLIKQQGWTPDLVISHSGWGCGIFVKEIWPNTKHISYLEWWFNPNSSFYTFDPKNPNLNISQAKVSSQWIRNQHVALELVEADQIVTPTVWQLKQLPKSLQKRCHIIFDGIDISKFTPLNNKNPEIRPVITYGTRGMDPMRAFPQMIQSLPNVMSAGHTYDIEIAGDNKAYYGKALAASGEPWSEWAKKYLESAGISHRVKWVGQLHFDKYTEWVKSSLCHIYLTHPFIASWSLVESYVAGVPIVASDVEPVREICSPKDAISFTNHRDISNISNSILSSLETAKSMDRVKISSARRVDRFGIRNALRQWEHVAGLEVTTKD